MAEKNKKIEQKQAEPQQQDEKVTEEKQQEQLEQQKPSTETEPKQDNTEKQPETKKDNKENSEETSEKENEESGETLGKIVREMKKKEREEKKLEKQKRNEEKQKTQTHQEKEQRITIKAEKRFDTTVVIRGLTNVSVREVENFVRDQVGTTVRIEACKNNVYLAIFRNYAKAVQFCKRTNRQICQQNNRMLNVYISRQNRQ